MAKVTPIDHNENTRAVLRLFQPQPACFVTDREFQVLFQRHAFEGALGSAVSTAFVFPAEKGFLRTTPQQRDG